MTIKLTVTISDGEKGIHANAQAKRKDFTQDEEKCAYLLFQLIELYFSEIGANENRIKGVPHVH